LKPGLSGKVANPFFVMYNYVMLSSKTAKYVLPGQAAPEGRTGAYFPDALIDHYAAVLAPVQGAAFSGVIGDISETSGPEPIISEAQGKALILEALEAFSPALAARAATILNSARLNLHQVAPGEIGMMRVRAAGLRQEDTLGIDATDLPQDKKDELKTRYPDDANEKGEQAIIDYDYDGTARSVIYLAHELGHALADDLQNEAGYTYRDNPVHLEETQAYLIQHIVNRYLNRMNDADGHLAQAAQQSFTADMIGNMRDMALSLAALDFLQALEQGENIDPAAIFAQRCGAHWERWEDQSEAVQNIQDSMMVVQTTNDLDVKNNALDLLQRQAGRLHGRSTSILTALSLAAQLESAPDCVREHVATALLGGQGPLNIAQVLATAGIEWEGDMQLFAQKGAQAAQERAINLQCREGALVNEPTDNGLMESFRRPGNITTAQIGPQNLAAYKEFCMKLSQPERYEKFWADNGAMLSGKESGFTLFGLWDGDQMIGQTMIAFDPDGPDRRAVFCESEIIPEYRGRGYAQHLYDARMRYLKETGFDVEIEAHIKPDNQPSLKAAQRNGFQQTGEMHKGFCVLKG